jgi:hypothetical protein
MPFVSQAQRRKFGELVKQGKISQATFDEWERATPNALRLPERVTPQKPVTRRKR